MHDALASHEIPDMLLKIARVDYRGLLLPQMGGGGSDGHGPFAPRTICPLRKQLGNHRASLQASEDDSKVIANENVVLDNASVGHINTVKKNMI